MSECTVSRMTSYMNDLNIPDMPAEEAWDKLKLADQEKDVHDINNYILAYAKVRQP